MVRERQRLVVGGLLEVGGGDVCGVERREER